MDLLYYVWLWFILRQCDNTSKLKPQQTFNSHSVRSFRINRHLMQYCASKTQATAMNWSSSHQAFLDQQEHESHVCCSQAWTPLLKPGELVWQCTECQPLLCPLVWNTGGGEPSSVKDVLVYRTKPADLHVSHPRYTDGLIKTLSPVTKKHAEST